MELTVFTVNTPEAGKLAGSPALPHHSGTENAICGSPTRKIAAGEPCRRKSNEEPKRFKKSYSSYSDLAFSVMQLSKIPSPSNG
jgi:hypothetical protein